MRLIGPHQGHRGRKPYATCRPTISSQPVCSRSPHLTVRSAGPVCSSQIPSRPGVAPGEDRIEFFDEHGYWPDADERLRLVPTGHWANHRPPVGTPGTNADQMHPAQQRLRGSRNGYCAPSAESTTVMLTGLSMRAGVATTPRAMLPVLVSGVARRAGQHAHRDARDARRRPSPRPDRS